jgi:hypothetical protein
MKVERWSAIKTRFAATWGELKLNVKFWRRKP